MQTNIKNVILAAAVSTLIVGCQSPRPVAKTEPQGICLHCADNPANKKLAGTPFVTDWLAPSQRSAPVVGINFQNQDGADVSFKDLRGAPVAVSFIYTRCDNERKCPLVARTLGELALLVQRASISPKPSFLLVTYDPEFDKPSVLREFASTHGFQWTPRAMLLRPHIQGRDALFSNLNVRVNYNERGVNLHGIQLLLLDKQGRYVRTYHSLLWDNTEVLRDLARLSAE